MNNAETILRALDKHLTARVELTLYGRAALQLGFSKPPSEYAQSMDVDGVFWMGQAESLMRIGNFWEAVEITNRELAPQGLYISHFFEESQLILTAQWRQQRMPINGSWQNLCLMRLSDQDLFLTKLMRYDPLDLGDAQFILERSGMTRQDVRALLEKARIPDIPEIRKQFSLCSKTFL
ncbi:MAG: hypothetical protein KKE37_07065 [Verrucomicrobia bacterium]|nr:hypothetical protein [Verrucomicrobiota bacterium]MBU4291528.1 hypothetical protein [Verrucomicrobiota bacterium]MBU4429097.1 hypothetical protein [Verrucomicrobiota bacterium]MCG2678639.1 hypothetical protein [Kiritimatiellia bacterium]